MNTRFSVQTVNPATGEPLETYTLLTDSELVQRIERAAELWEKRRREPLSRRLNFLENLRLGLLEGKAGFARLIVQEMGKPLNQAEAEIEKCAGLCRYYQENAERFLAPRQESAGYRESFVRYEPLGGVLGIMPWNFPFWQVFRFAVPALAAGNVVFLKHAENVFGAGAALQTLFDKAGAEGAFTNLPIREEQAVLAIKHPFVRLISFTGGVKGGRAVAAEAGRHLKKSVMELGGSDPYIVLKDADIAGAAKAVTQSRFNNSGQSCIAAKRLIVEKEICQDLTEALIGLLKNFTIGPPMQSPRIGPLAKEEICLALKAGLKEDLDKGAKVLFQKEPVAEESKRGFYFPVILLGEAKGGMFCEKEETFGPLLPVFAVNGEEEALRKAHETPFGLAAAVFTQDRKKGETWAKELLRAGSCFLNGAVRSHAALPFGGMKDSGYGKELSREGLREMTYMKTVAFCS